MRLLCTRINKEIKKFEKGLSPEQRRMWHLLLFLIKFGIASIPIYLIMFFDVDFFIVQNIEATQLNYLVNSLGTNSTLMYCGVSDCNLTGSGIPSVVYEGRAIGIDRACTGYRSFFALIGLILAVPGIERRKRLKGIAFAFVAVYLANTFRLLSTFYLSFIFDFEMIHGIMWRAGMIAVVFISWLFWLRKL